MSENMVVARNGEKIIVDVSPEAIARVCEKAGVPTLQPGGRFHSSLGDGTAIGVGYSTYSASYFFCREPEVLWVVLDEDDGRGSFWISLKDGDITQL